MSVSDEQNRLCNQRTHAGAESCRWRVVASSVRGTSHEKTGQPCQDAHRWEMSSEKIMLAAVADGAGSAPLGEVGATIAAQTAIDTIQ
jgi:hypothetical protein